MNFERGLFLLFPLASLIVAACGTRVAVAFVDSPGGDPEVDGAPPPPFTNDASRREAAAPSPGCADKSCGEPCSPCTAGDASACPPPAVFHVCSSQGECLPEQPGCVVIQELDGATSAPTYVPCAGRACGATCTSCDPGSAACSPSLGVCQVDGVCAAGSAECR